MQVSHHTETTVYSTTNGMSSSIAAVVMSW